MSWMLPWGGGGATSTGRLAGLECSRQVVRCPNDREAREASLASLWSETRSVATGGPEDLCARSRR